MTWTASTSRKMSIDETRSFVEEQFKKIYPFEIKNETVLFTLPDGSIMKVVSLGTKFNALVMDYTSSTDSDDGDMYYSACHFRNNKFHQFDFSIKGKCRRFEFKAG